MTDQHRQAVQQGLQQFSEVIDDADIDEWLASPMVLVGTVEQIIEDLQVRRERFGISYIVLRDSMADAFALWSNGLRAINILRETLRPCQPNP